MQLDAVDYWRLLNLVLSCVALVMLFHDMRGRFKAMSMRMQLMTQAMFILLISGGWASLENIIQDNPLGIRVPLTTAATLWVIIAVIWTNPELQSTVKEKRRGTPSDGR